MLKREKDLYEDTYKVSFVYFFNAAKYFYTCVLIFIKLGKSIHFFISLFL